MTRSAAFGDAEVPRTVDPKGSEAQPPAWPDEWVEALSDASLGQASSAAIFQRGKTYSAAGAVEVVHEDPMPEPALHAQVSGTQTYTTQVWKACPYCGRQTPGPA